MILPDSIKSSILILSGKRSFSNLFNDYKTSKGRNTNIHVNKTKISLLHAFHENLPFLGFVHYRASQSNCIEVVHRETFLWYKK